MMKTVSRLTMAAATATMAFAPIAAQANTRAGDSGAVYSASAPGFGRAATGEGQEEEGGFGDILLGLFAAGLIVAGIVYATQSDDEGQSPGT